MSGNRSKTVVAPGPVSVHGGGGGCHDKPTLSGAEDLCASAAAVPCLFYPPCFFSRGPSPCGCDLGRLQPPPVDKQPRAPGYPVSGSPPPEKDERKRVLLGYVYIFTYTVIALSTTHTAARIHCGHLLVREIDAPPPPPLGGRYYRLSL